MHACMLQSERDVPQGQNLGRVTDEPVMVVNDALCDGRKVLDAARSHVVQKFAQSVVVLSPLGSLERGAAELQKNLVICSRGTIRQRSPSSASTTPDLVFQLSRIKKKIKKN